MEKWLRRAAKAGHIAAMFNLGVVLHEQGEKDEAEKWYRQAAETGYLKAMFNLGRLTATTGTTI